VNKLFEADEADVEAKLATERSLQNYLPKKLFAKECKGVDVIRREGNGINGMLRIRMQRNVGDKRFVVLTKPIPKEHNAMKIGYTVRTVLNSFLLDHRTTTNKKLIIYAEFIWNYLMNDTQFLEQVPADDE